jgi:signal transduction histidine kinase
MQENPDRLPIRILHLEDSATDHELVIRALVRAGLVFNMQRVETLPDFDRTIKSEVFDVVLADYRLPGFTAIDAWQVLQTHSLRPPFVLLSGAIGEAAAVEAIKLGMSDYLQKDDLGKLAQVINRAIEMQATRLAKERADTELARSEKRLADFAEHLQMTIEQERAAIAREIHDDIGGSLAAIKFDLAWVGRHTNDPITLSHIQAATDMLHHALGASQRIMMNLRPAILDQGLVAALDWLSSGFEKRTAIKTSFSSSPLSADITKAVQLTAYRTAQEALTNISKHARCDHVRIEISDAKSVLTLEVTDNGTGISAIDRDKPKAFGLKGLHERAKTVGGWLDVSTRAGVGTSIILSVPLSHSNSLSTQELFQ